MPKTVVKPKTAGRDQLGRPLWKADSVFGQKVCGEFPSVSQANGEHAKKTVELDTLRPTQPKLDASKVNGFLTDAPEKPEPIHLIAGSKGPRILDGHHRAAAAILRGDSTIEAIVWEPEESHVAKRELQETPVTHDEDQRPSRPESLDEALAENTATNEDIERDDEETKAALARKAKERRLIRKAGGRFDESKHKRDKGKFASKGGGGIAGTTGGPAAQLMAGGSRSWTATKRPERPAKLTDDEANALFDKKQAAARKKAAKKAAKGKRPT